MFRASDEFEGRRHSSFRGLLGIAKVILSPGRVGPVGPGGVSLVIEWPSTDVHSNEVATCKPDQHDGLQKNKSVEGAPDSEL